MFIRNPKHIYRFVGILVLQILMFQQNYLFMELNPVVYLLFPLTLSPSENKSYVLITSFIMGILVDIFYNTIGLHSSAILLVVLLRPIGLRAIRIKSLDLSEELTINKIPIPTFFIFLLFFSLIHQFYLVFLSKFSFWNLHDLKYIGINTLFSVVVMLMLHIVFTPDNSRKR